MNVLEANLLEKYPKLEIRTVDGFQGREKEVVILSLVRSNIKNNLGFIVEKRRLNVGVTRARRQLVLVCDSSTVCRDEFLGNFVSYMKDNGSVEEAPTLDTLDLPRRSKFDGKRKAAGSNKEEREAGPEKKKFKRIVFDEKLSEKSSEENRNYHADRESVRATTGKSKTRSNPAVRKLPMNDLRRKLTPSKEEPSKQTRTPEVILGAI